MYQWWKPKQTQCHLCSSGAWLCTYTIRLVCPAWLDPSTANVPYIATIVCMCTMQQHYLQYTQTTLHPISQYSFKHVSIRQMPQSITFSWNPWPTGFSTPYSAHSKSSSIFYSNTYPHLMTPKQRQQSNAWPWCRNCGRNGLTSSFSYKLKSPLHNITSKCTNQQPSVTPNIMP